MSEHQGVNVYVIIAAAALLTYATRIGGYLIVSRFRTLPPRVEAGLEAVPAAVIAALVAPAAFSRGPMETAALAITFLVGLRADPMTAVGAGTLSLIAMRAAFGG